MRAAVVFGAVLVAGVAAAGVASGGEPSRVGAARAKHAAEIERLFASKKVPYPPRTVLLRVLKDDDQVELWVEPAKGKPFVHLKDYAICARSGELGPKRMEGDGQVPEGFYEITGLNPQSAYHLALRVGYPNEADRLRNKPNRLGGDIMIHGNCVTIGCIPLRDEPIEELYLIAQDTKLAGGTIHAHIFPARMDDTTWPKLEAHAHSDAALRDFWLSLRPGYLWFDQKHTLPRISVDPKGLYTLR